MFDGLKKLRLMLLNPTGFHQLPSTSKVLLGFCCHTLNEIPLALLFLLGATNKFVNHQTLELPIGS